MRARFIIMLDGSTGSIGTARGLYSTEYILDTKRPITIDRPGGKSSEPIASGKNR